MAPRTTRNSRKRPATSPPPAINTPVTTNTPNSEMSSVAQSSASTRVLVDNATNAVFTRLADILAERLPVATPNPTAPPTQRIHVTSEVIPPFDPSKTGANIKTWCHTVDQMAQIYGWSDQITSFYALTRLEGLAQGWYHGRRNFINSWEEWKALLVTAFPPLRNYAMLLRNILARQKRVNESYTQYYYEKLAMVDEVRMTGEEAVSCIIDGITEPCVLSGAQAGRHLTPESLFGFLSTYNVAVPKLVENVAAKSGGSAKSVPVPSTLQTSVDARTSRRPTCHKCNKVGHIARYCRVNPQAVSNQTLERSQVTCHKCGRVGHYATTCSTRDSSLRDTRTLVRCTYCQKVGHVVADCRIKQRADEKVPVKQIK